MSASTARTRGQASPAIARHRPSIRRNAVRVSVAASRSRLGELDQLGAPVGWIAPVGSLLAVFRKSRPVTGQRQIRFGVGTLAFVSQLTDDDNGDDASAGRDHRPMFTGFGIASAVLGALCVAAVVLTSLIFAGHREERAELAHQARVVQTAVSWAGVLINMNKDNIESSLQKLHDGTVGELNTEFDKTIQPYTNLVKTLQTKTTGQIDSASVEALHRDPNAQSGGPPRDPVPGLTSRTDTVLIVASSVSETSGGKPQTVHWNLRVGVSDVSGQLLVSRLDLVR